MDAAEESWRVWVCFHSVLGSWRDRTQKEGEATANEVKSDKGANQMHINERLDRCSHQQRGRTEGAGGHRALRAPEWLIGPARAEATKSVGVKWA